MKHILLTLFISFTSISLFSQDLSVERWIYPHQGMKIHEMFHYPVEFEIKNNSTNKVPNGGSIFIYLYVNGVQYLTYDGMGGVFNRWVWSPANGFNGGASGQLELPTDSIWQSRASTLNMCVEVEYSGDNNASNDSSCITLSYSNDTLIDFMALDVEITLPELTGFELEPEETIYRLSGRLINTGNVTLPRDYRVKAEYETLGKQGTRFTDVELSMANGDTATIDFLPFVDAPKEEGPFPICIRVDSDTDDDNTNDEICTNYVVKKSENPGPTSINETERDQPYLYLDQHQLVLENMNEGPNTVQIFDNQGRIIENRILRVGENRMNLSSNIQNGVYIVNVLNNNTGNQIQLKFTKM